MDEPVTLAPVPDGETIPPQNLDAEESVLGAMLLSPSALDAVAEIVQAGDFYRKSHGVIYQAALDLHAKGESVDAITLADFLEERGHLTDAGGKIRLYELAKLVPATANAGHYARIVREMATLRTYIRVGGDLARLGWERPGDLAELEQRALDLVARLDGSASAATLEVVSLDDFVSVTEDASDPLIGVRGDSLLPADGLLLMYGDGGAGKTTLTIDALAHLASGTSWLDTQISRPVRTLLIENEGPRGPFRETLAGKKAKWKGEPFSRHVSVLQEPWTRFTLDDTAYRVAIAAEIRHHEIDLVIVGPLASLGAKGTGTPDDVNDFARLIADLRRRAGRPFALWIIHHENKAGDVSGAWERLPDTLVHVSAQGNGRTRVHWRKVRWSSRLHNTSVNLLWDDGGYQFEEARIRDLPNELIVKFAQADDRWLTAKQASVLISANVDKVRDTLQQLTIEGKMVFQIGPPGRSGNAKCWRLRTDSDPPSHPESLDLFEGGGTGTDSVTPPMNGVTRVSHTTSPHPTDSDPPSQVTPADHLDYLATVAPSSDEPDDWDPTA